MCHIKKHFCIKTHFFNAKGLLGDSKTSPMYHYSKNKAEISGGLINQHNKQQHNKQTMITTKQTKEGRIEY
jgi:hypothetical protein